MEVGSEKCDEPIEEVKTAGDVEEPESSQLSVASGINENEIASGINENEMPLSGDTQEAADSEKSGFLDSCPDDSQTTVPIFDILKSPTAYVSGPYQREDLSSSSSLRNRTKDQPKKPSGHFECNICFDDATEPVVTRCGHLYCWACLSSWLDRGQLECPVCKAGVSCENVIPLYGRGDTTKRDCRTSTQRPRAERPRVTVPPSQAYRRHDPAWTTGGISMSVFPFAMWNISIAMPFWRDLRQVTRPTTQEEARNRTLGALFLGIIVLCVLKNLSSIITLLWSL